MPSRDPVAQMCADMGLPPPRELMRAAREAVSGAAGPARCPTWPPGFVPQVPDMMADEGRKTASGSAVERSRKATEARQQAADAGQGWGKGTAIDKPAQRPLPTTPRPRVATVRMPPPVRAAKPVYTFRGESLAYKAWALLSGGLRLRVRDVAQALDVSDADLRQAILVPQRRKVLVLDAGHLMRGPAVPGMPSIAREGAAQ